MAQWNKQTNKYIITKYVKAIVSVQHTLWYATYIVYLNIAHAQT